MERMNKMNRKGDATDTITVIFWVFVLAVVIVVLVFALGTTFTYLAESPLGDDNSTLDGIYTAQSYINNTLPMTYFILFCGLLLGIFVSSYFVREHMIFLPVYIFILIATIFVAVALGNAWGALQDVDVFQETLASNSIFQAIDLIVSHIVLVTLVVFIISIVVIFAKPSGGAAGGAPY